MITELIVKNSQRNAGSVHCQDCWKIIGREKDSIDPLSQEAIDLLMSTAYHHELLHPTHVMTVTIYEREVLPASS